MTDDAPTSSAESDWFRLLASVDDPTLRARATRGPSAFDRLRELSSEVGYMRHTAGSREFVWVDSQAARTLGVDPASVLRDPSIWDCHVMTDEASESVDDLVEGDPPRTIRHAWRLDDGEVLTVEERALIARDHDDSVLRVGVMRSIGELARAEMRLAGEMERLELILDGTQLGVWDWDLHADVMTVNERWAGIAGQTLPEVAPVGIDTWRAMIHASDIDESDELMERHVEGDTAHYDVEHRILHRDGQWVWVHDRAKVIEWDADGRPLRMTGTREDITRRRESDDAMRDQMLLDPLTSLGNRRMMDARLDDLVSGARVDGEQFGVLVVDIDHFKQVNDHHGHLIGDVALRAVADCLAAAIRPTDVAIRQAGDEFCVLLPGSDPTGVSVVADRLLQLVNRAAILAEHGAAVTVSVGAAHSAELADLDEDAVLRLADERLYDAKRSGRNRVVT